LALGWRWFNRLDRRMNRERSRPAAQAGMDGQQGRPLRVLIGECDANDARHIARALQHAGFSPEYRRIQTARVLQSALDDAVWDLLILDHGVPHLSHGQALEAIDARDLDIPVILVSAHRTDAHAAEAMRAGVSDYVLKSDLARLGPVVQRELREADNRREHRLVAAELERMAARDALTGLANRGQLELHLADVCQRIDTLGHAFLYLNVDQFRLINEQGGHPAGDDLIRRLAAVIAGVIRPGAVLARIGPDEFAVLVEQCPAPRAWRLAEQLRRAVNGFRFAWDGRSYRIGVSIGVVAIDEQALEPPEILRRADLACRAAKAQGSNSIRLYAEADAECAQRRGATQWVARLQQALERDELVLFAQSIGCVGDPARRPHAELLVRLQEADGRLVEPGMFIPAAEHFELMPEIDRWVIEHAFRHIGSAPVRGGRWFINLSGISLSDETLADHVGEQLRARGVDARRICFEITETAAIGNMNAALRFMTHVRELGCAVALDDFGSGLSSFTYLKSLPADYLKIDGSFVRAMADEQLDLTIVDAIARIGQAAGKQVIGEGVESKGVVQMLGDLDVDYAQGYALAPPLPLDRLLHPG